MGAHQLLCRHHVRHWRQWPETLHVVDFKEHPAYRQRDPGAVRFVELAGVRTFVAVPMLKEGELIGTINIFRWLRTI
jgi:GAF domain-containing protein